MGEITLHLTWPKFRRRRSCTYVEMFSFPVLYIDRRWRPKATHDHNSIVIVVSEMDVNSRHRTSTHPSFYDVHKM